MTQKIGFYFRRHFFIYQLINSQPDILVGQVVGGRELTNEFFEHVSQSKE